MQWGQFGPLVSEQLVTELVRTNRVMVLERKQLGALTGEIDRGDSEYFNKASVAEKGQFLGAQAMFTGSITEFEPDAAGFGGSVDAKIVSAKLEHGIAKVGMEIRLVDIETSKVIEAVHVEGKASRTSASIGVSYLGIGGSVQAWHKTPLGYATREAIEKGIDFILQKLDSIPWAVPVKAAPDKENIVLAGGSDLNLKAGDRFALMSVKEIKDDKGQVVAKRESPLGQIELTQVQNDVAFAKLLEGELPKAGDLARLPPSAQLK
jgi:curli biogenesis system outer membrane secretion channel CsgG